MAHIPGFLRYSIAAFLVFTATALSSGATAAESETTNSLPPAVSKALKDAGIAPHNVAIVVQPVDAAAPLLSVNAERAFNPASVMKLVTTFAALDIFGPAFTWATEVRTDAAPTAAHLGRLAGNLYLRGSGDPRLALEQFWLMLRRLHDLGIRDIAGDLVLDRTAFDLPPHDSAAFDNEPLRPYNAGPDALMVNFKSLNFVLHADLPRNTVEIYATTPSATLRVSNRLTLSQGGCGDWRERLQITATADEIAFVGNYAASCADKTLNISPWPADQQVEQLFRALWQELGGSLHGQVRSGSTPEGAELLATHESPTLGEVVREINKYSNNVMARQVFLTLDADRPATPAGAAQRIKRWLDEQQLSMPELVLENGSGLSRSERISADSLARLLLAAWHSPVMPELMASLPLAGIDGTMKKRLGNSAAAGRAHLKTGYLDGVRAIAGYVQDSRDQRWVVVFLINDANFRAGKPAMDSLLRWVAEH